MKKIDITKFFNIKNLKKIVQIIFTDHLDTQHQQLFKIHPFRKKV